MMTLWEIQDNTNHIITDKESSWLDINTPIVKFKVLDILLNEGQSYFFMTKVISDSSGMVVITSYIFGEVINDKVKEIIATKDGYTTKQYLFSEFPYSKDILKQGVNNIVITNN